MKFSKFALLLVVVFIAVGGWWALNWLNGSVFWYERTAIGSFQQPTTQSERLRRPAVPSAEEPSISTTDEALFYEFGVGNLTAVNDRRLLAHIRGRLSRPSPTRPRRLASTDHARKHFSQVGQSKLVDDLLARRRNGFFVECGAYNGEVFSNSLFFELERNWTGLLIEANPNNYRTLLEKNRNAYVLGACLSPTRRPGQWKFKQADVLGGIVDKILPGHMNRIEREKIGGAEVMVNCYPFNSVMDALGVRDVDYFSLDIEGPELDVLETIDFERYRIDLLTIEYPISGEVLATVKKLQNIRKLFERTKLYREVMISGNFDVVFKRI